MFLEIKSVIPNAFSGLEMTGRIGGEYSWNRRGGCSGLEGRTLLHDRDVLLSGNHLCKCVKIKPICQIESTTAMGASIYLDGLVVG